MTKAKNSGLFWSDQEYSKAIAIPFIYSSSESSFCGQLQLTTHEKAVEWQIVGRWRESRQTQTHAREKPKRPPSTTQRNIDISIYCGAPCSLFLLLFLLPRLTMAYSMSSNDPIHSNKTFTDAAHCVRGGVELSGVARCAQCCWCALAQRSNNKSARKSGVPNSLQATTSLHTNGNSYVLATINR